MRLYTVTLLVVVLFCRPSYGTLGYLLLKDTVKQVESLVRENTRLLISHDQRQTTWMEKDYQYYLTMDHVNNKIVGMEQFMKKIKEDGRIQLRKTTDAMNNLEKRLLSVVSSAESKLSELLSRPIAVQQPPIIDRSAEIINKLSTTEAMLTRQVAELKLESSSMAIKLKEVSTSQSETVQVVSGKLSDIAERIGNLENSVRALKEASQCVKDPPQNRIPDPSPAIEEQTRALKNLTKFLEEISDRIQKIPIAKEVTSLLNGTLAAVQESTDAIKNLMTREVATVKENIVESKNETANSVSQLRSDLAINTVDVKQKLDDFEKAHWAMADRVLDGKNRVENSVQEILVKVGDLVNTQRNCINDMLNLRLDVISSDILVGQSSAVANLTTKMEQEMHQLWQQISVVYQQMMENATALDNIHKQDAIYADCTTSKIRGMKNKVGGITKGMATLDEHLNYLMERLSLVAQKFKEMTRGLVTTLDDIETSFEEVQEKANGLSNRGPHHASKNCKEPAKTDVLTKMKAL